MRQDCVQQHEQIEQPFCPLCPAKEKAFCATLTPAARSCLEGWVTHLKLRAGDLLAEDGEPARDILTVAEGVVMTYEMLTDGRRQVSGFRFAGELLALPRRGGASRTSVKAITAATLCRLSRSGLEQIRGLDPEIGERLLDLASAEIASAREHMLLLGRRSATEKVASFLVDVGRRNGRRTNGSLAIDMPMTREDIADYLGLNVETVSRVFTRLKSAGAFDLPKPTQAVVKQLDTLAGIA